MQPREWMHFWASGPHRGAADKASGTSATFMESCIGCLRMLSPTSLSNQIRARSREESCHQKSTRTQSGEQERFLPEEKWSSLYLTSASLKTGGCSTRLHFWGACAPAKYQPCAALHTTLRLSRWESCWWHVPTTPSGEWKNR